MGYIPIVVFAYNRPVHLRIALQSLSECKEANESEVFIFIDGPKSDAGVELNKKVEQVAHNFDNGKFKRLTINNSMHNKGLARSIIGGVDDIVKKYGKVIVIEDDVKVSPHFLSFMNESLKYYENDLRVWSIGGYIAPLNLPEDFDKDYITTQRVSSIAWGIWLDRWEKIDWRMQDYNSFRRNLFKRIAFNKWGEDRSSMLDDQMEGTIDSWAIRFDYAMFANNMYNIVPIKSLVKFFLDGSGTHNTADMKDNKKTNIDLENGLNSYKLGPPYVNFEIQKAFRRFYKLDLIFRVKMFIKRNILR